MEYYFYSLDLDIIESLKQMKKQSFCPSSLHFFAFALVKRGFLDYTEEKRKRKRML